MEHTVWLTVLGITGLLALAVLMVPVANRLNFPFTVMLAAVGIVIGIVEHLLPEKGLGPISDLVESLHTLEITSEAVFFVFLPALVFESALAIDVRRLMDDIAPILTLAVVGLLISTVVVGLSVYQVSGMALIACLLLGAIVSATDPVAVVAIFKDLGAPKRLAILVEGESLFNDATAIVVFTILSAMLLGQSDAGVLSGIGSFLKVFLGGVLVGYVLARLVCAILAVLGEATLPKITLTIALAYMSFIVAEHYLHMSGVMAVVTASLVVGSRGRSVITPTNWHGLEEVWEQIGFAANSIIFVLVGIAVPTLMAGMTGDQFLWLVVILVAGFIARFAIIFGIVPLLARLGWAADVAVGYRAVMFWGGLRGAVSLALALAVMENPAYDDETRAFIGVLVTGFVLFTLAINATTVQFVMKFFGLDKLSPADEAIRCRVLSTSLTDVGEKIREAAEERGFDEATSQTFSQPIADRAAEAAGESDVSAITDDDWMRIGLKTITLRENQIYHRLFDRGFIAEPELARLLFSRTADLLDAVRARGVDGYEDVSTSRLEFDWQIRFAARMQRQFGWSGPLTKRLALRFKTLGLTINALDEILETEDENIVRPDQTAALRAIVQHRLERNQQALDALVAAYPEYAMQLRQLTLHQISGRLEMDEFKRLLSQATISKEVYSSLVGEVKSREKAFPRPVLDLGLDAKVLVGKVPFFADLSDAHKAEIAAMLKPSLALPGEAVVRKGDKGDSMYFISSGALRVALDAGSVTLGSGDCFGEMALVTDQPRNTDVYADGFCDLLKLYQKDFEVLMDKHPDLKATIERVAAERAAD
ncbi:MAG: cation:proton antiporter [Pseudomonadota bacterium]